MQLPADPNNIPFYDPALAQARLESVKTRVPEQLFALLLPLLADAPDSDWCLNQLDRWLSDSPEIVETLARHTQLAHYAVLVLSTSRYLGETLMRNPDLLSAFLREDSLQRGRSRDDFHEAWARFRARSLAPTADPDIALLLARFKRREYVRILLRDVLKRATLADITSEISALSDVLIEEALLDAASKLSKKYSPPQHLDASGRRVETPFSVLSLGKLGGNELNYSSDVDLQYVYGEEQAPPGAVISNREYFVRLAQEMTQTLSRVTQEGPVFRIDMRLRPQGAEGELALSQQQLLAYYSEEAQDWELQALIKVRYSAGDEALARECIRGVQPYVYRGTTEATESPLSFAAIETALQARERMITKRRPTPGVIHTLDVKLDRGGIRDIEFLAQCLQRVHGGREPWLRSRGTLFALQKLHDKNHISGRDFQELTATYEFFRQVEHRLQLRMGQQTHRLPSSPEELRVLERSMARHLALQHASQTVEEALREHMAAVSEIYRRIIHHQQWRLQEETAEAGFALSPSREPASDLPYNVMLDRLAQDAPRLFAAAQATEAGSLGRRNLQRFLSSIFSSSTRYAILLRHPEALPSAIQLFETSGYLTDVLVQYPEECVTLADLAAQPALQPAPVAEGYLFGPSSRWQTAASDPVFQFVATSNSSHSEKLALLRRHHRHLSFVTGVRDLMELRPVYQSFSAHSAAADDAIRAAFALAGRPDGLAVLALGRLGGSEFDVFSDADLIFARHETLPVEIAQKAGEQIVNALAAYTREGMVFPVDARLRPHGGEGELVLTSTAFGSYCEDEAHAWEALSYAKLRFLCGSSEVAGQMQDAARKAFTRFASSPNFASALHEMRARLEQSASESNWKSSPGGIYDIDFLTGFLLLKSAIPKKDGSLRDRLWRLADAGVLTKAEASELDHAAELLRTVEHVSALVAGRRLRWLPTAPHTLQACERWASGILRSSFANGLASAIQQTMQAVREIYVLRLR